MGLFGGAAKTRILLAEDDPTTRALLEEILQASQFSVTCAEDGIEAWERVQQGGFALVILDHHMPGMDGLQVVKAMRAGEDTRKTPVLMLTGNNTTGLMAEAYRLHVADFINKPCNMEEFVLKVKIALDRAAQAGS